MFRYKRSISFSINKCLEAKKQFCIYKISLFSLSFTTFICKIPLFEKYVFCSTFNIYMFF